MGLDRQSLWRSSFDESRPASTGLAPMVSLIKFHHTFLPWASRSDTLGGSTIALRSLRLKNSTDS